MNVEKLFHMTGGHDDTSYAKNSSLQKKAADMVMNITREAIQEIYRATTPKSIGMADLGCSSGPNTLSVIKEFIYTVEATSHKLICPPPEFRIHLNDLPSNDFNSIFQALPDFYTQLKEERVDNGGPSVFISANPGSFYGRLFPNRCLHFIYSSYCLHWLSKVPPGLYDEQGKSINKGSMYMSKSSPPQVLEAYYNQFQDDFSLFLKLRSQELVKGGRMVLIFLGRSNTNHVDRGNSFLWEALSRSLATLASRGEIEDEKIDSYDVHFYAPCKEEIEKVVRKEGSFEMDRLEMFELEKGGENGVSYGTRVAMAVRAIQESMISHHFGEGIVENLFEVYRSIIDEEMAIEEIRPITFVLVLNLEKETM